MARNRRAASAVCCLIALCAAGTIAAQSWDAGIPSNLDRMTSSYYLPSVNAAFGTFTYGYSELATPFSRWLEERLADGAARSKGVKILNRAAAAAMDPAFKAMYGELFSSNQVGALLHGRYFEEGENVRARIELTGLSDGLLIGSSEFLIPRRALPAGLSVAPERQAAATAASLASVLPAPARDLRVSVSTERGPGAVYREGEDMVVLVTLNRDAYVKVYHIDVHGTVQLIWPNRFGGGKGLLRSGAAIRIPGSGDPFAFRMTPPYGTEFIKVIASTEPFAATEADFAALGGAGQARDVISRGIALAGPTPSASPAASPEAGRSVGASGGAGPAMAEAIASYVIMEALR